MSERYNRYELLGLLIDYKNMIERDAGKHPAAVLDDIHASIKHILKEIKKHEQL